MTTTTLKNKLIEKINSINDKEELEYLTLVIDNVSDKDEIYILTEKEKELIDKSEKDFEEGRVVSNEEVFERVNKLLK
jgi:predicted transcriptional regulator